MLVGDALDEGNDELEPRHQRAVVLAEPLDDPGELLRHDLERAHDEDDDEDRDDECDFQSANLRKGCDDEAAAFDRGYCVLSRRRHAVADATADALRKVGAAIREPGGEQAVQLKVAQQAVEAFAQLAQKNNTLIVPSNMTEVSALIASAMTLVRGTSAPAAR
jgi:hypothetical protein